MLAFARNKRAVLVSARGGGGYGPPSEREPEQVRRDVAERWISAERARDVYRVALNDHLEVDTEKTKALRAKS